MIWILLTMQIDNRNPHKKAQWELKEILEKIRDDLVLDKVSITCTLIDYYDHDVTEVKFAAWPLICQKLISLLDNVYEPVKPNKHYNCY